mmetsp:Transcript_77044/g.200715  ORF Transcript_77044/g.200715 Transcript_77044/m.200715 type:complete len:203 (-) Transcript_77044:77-685(-)
MSIRSLRTRRWQTMPPIRARLSWSGPYSRGTMTSFKRFETAHKSAKPDTNCLWCIRSYFTASWISGTLDMFQFFVFLSHKSSDNFSHRFRQRIGIRHVLQQTLLPEAWPLVPGPGESILNVSLLAMLFRARVTAAQSTISIESISSDLSSSTTASTFSCIRTRSSCISCQPYSPAGAAAPPGTSSRGSEAGGLPASAPLIFS